MKAARDELIREWDKLRRTSRMQLRRDSFFRSERNDHQILPDKTQIKFRFAHSSSEVLALLSRRDALPDSAMLVPYPSSPSPSIFRPTGPHPPDRSFRSLTHLSSSFRSPLLFPPYPFIRGSSLFPLSLPFLLTTPFPPRPHPSTLTRQARLITMREFREFGRRSDFCPKCSFPLSNPPSPKEHLRLVTKLPIFYPTQIKVRHSAFIQLRDARFPQ